MKKLFQILAILILLCPTVYAADSNSPETMKALKQKGIHVEEYPDYTITTFDKYPNILYFTTKQNNPAHSLRVEVELAEKDGALVEKITPSYDNIKEGSDLKARAKGFYASIQAKIDELKMQTKDKKAK